MEKKSGIAEWFSGFKNKYGKIGVAVLVVLVVLAVWSVVDAFAVNPQAPSASKYVAGGDGATVILFGPYARKNAAPSAYMTWSTDGSHYWQRFFFNGSGVGRQFEASPNKIPSSFMEAAPAAMDTFSGGQWWSIVEVNASAVAVGDSVVIRPYFGGVGQ